MNLVASVILGVLLGVPPAEDIQKAARRIRADSNYQTRLPGHTEPVEVEAPRPPGGAQPAPVRRPTPANAGGSRPRPSRRTGSGAPAGSGLRSDSSEPGAGLGNALLWMLLGVAAVLGFVWIARRLSGRTRDIEAHVRTPGKAPEAPLALARTKTAAERLADAGHHDQAIHVLLLETLGQLAERLPGGMRASWTSREILARVTLPDPAREALTGLVVSVETSLFGHASPGAREYEASADAFEAFRGAMAHETPTVVSA